MKTIKTSHLQKALRLIPASLTVYTLTFGSLSASAATPQSVIEKSRLLSQTIRTYSQSLSPRELTQLETQLDRALQIALGRGGVGSGGGYPVDPCPPGRRCGPGNGGGGYVPASTCRLLGNGSANGWTYQYRIALNDQVMEGTNDFEAAIKQLNRYVQDGMCVLAQEDTCKLAGPGKYAGWTYNFRVVVGEAAFAGSNNSADALHVLKRLEESGVCRVNVRMESCQLLGRGNYSGWTYNYRVAVGADVLSGTNDYNEAKSFMDTLRIARVCY